ncbi:MAG TPA: YdcF family protein, partial [Acetobacteraceae bacterium]|nr:YdcF family protein [Acetobacteraceae bacterium]
MKGGVSRTVAMLGGLIAAAWLGGFVWFADDAVRVPPPPPAADGIVALTGGAERVAAAIDLLQANRGRLL